MNTPEIKCTNDYSKFSLLVGNRVVNKSKINKLMEEVTNGLNLFPYCPIVTYKDGDSLKIIDGQHRFTASKDLEEPIYYVVCKKLSLPQIAKLNSNSSNWKSKDYLECFIKVGITDYEDIKSVIKKYRIAYAVACDLLMSGNAKSKGKNLVQFKEGTFKSKYYQENCDLLDEVESVFGRYEFWNHGYLVEAYRQLLEANKFDKDILVKKIKSNTNILDRRTSVKEYLFNIERVYNDRNQNRVSIF